MIFLRYESFRGFLKLYPVTSALISANLIMFILTMLNGGSTNPETLYRFGALYPPLMDGMSDMWRLVGAMFLHAGFDHLLFNMFALVVFAPPLERVFGSMRYGIFYFLCGIAGSVLSLTMLANVLSVGASGAIYGFYGAYLYLILFRKQALDPSSRKTIQIILGIGIVYSIIVPQVNIWGHLGGFIAGFLLFPSFIRRLKKPPQSG
ncbi:rhomboid family intramembrane serine protease [Xylanibacillus composti]|uniref:Putative rhomboid protease YdcA n=1 Tax=Xylanibacillus composti TaxID=1572762 RepID=A0A8J4M1M3_9BACL|nr:rhomboid family intramembrane serine protease [Xylanibacillus composti]MDT9724970.1 rhomboid family intramembrane serine protease [Xylanibacillus composti]GIQ68210.1 putative rhomboid protease YdcA [Xylanibacillus composti]